MADRHDDRALAQALDRAWDDAFGIAPAGADPSALEPTDSGLAATVRRVHALDRAPATDPSFADRLWEDLMLGHATAGTLAPQPGAPMAPDTALPVALPRRTPGRPIPMPRPRYQWALSQLGVAALLLAMLGLGYVAYRAGFAGDDPPQTVPAALQAASPSPEIESTAPPDVAGDAILRLELPAEVMATSPGGASIFHLTVSPGDAATWTVPQAVLFHYVVSGTLTMRPEAPAQVLRSGESAWTQRSAGEEIVLEPGDAVLLVDDVSAAYANDGAVAVETVTWMLSNERTAGDPLPASWTLNDFGFDEDLLPAAHPGSPAVLRLRRIVLAPNGELPAPAAGESRLRVGVPFNGAGTPVPVTLARRENGYAANYGTESVLVYELTVAFGTPEASPAAGTPAP